MAFHASQIHNTPDHTLDVPLSTVRGVPTQRGDQHGVGRPAARLFLHVVPCRRRDVHIRDMRAVQVDGARIRGARAGEEEGPGQGRVLQGRR